MDLDDGSIDTPSRLNIEREEFIRGRELGGKGAGEQGGGETLPIRFSLSPLRPFAPAQSSSMIASPTPTETSRRELPSPDHEAAWLTNPPPSIFSPLTVTRALPTPPAASAVA